MSSTTLPGDWRLVGDGHGLRGRWQWPPVAGQGRHQQIRNVVEGVHRDRAFIAFTTPGMAIRGRGFLTVGAIETARPLPRASIEPQDADDKLALAALRRLTTPARTRGVAGVDRITGPSLDPAFDNRYRVRTRYPDDTRELLSAPVRAALLASNGVALAYEGRDVLCWQESTERERLDVTIVERLLDVAAIAVNELR